MKLFKIVNIASDGSISFSYNSKNSDLDKSIFYLKHDERNFMFNQKKIKASVESEYSSYHKRRYLKR